MQTVQRQTVQRILVPTDFSPCGNEAVEQAVELALAHGARLDVLHVIPDEDDPMRIQQYGTFDDLAPDPLAITSKADLAMQALLKPYDSDTLSLHRVQTFGDPADAILTHITNASIDLVVIGTHGRTGVSRWVMGSVAEQVVRRAACSVLVVRSTRKRTTDLRRIAAAVDLSDLTPAVLEKAVGLAQENGARLDVLHVIEPFAVPISLTGIATLSDLVPDVERKIRDRIHGLMDKVVSTPQPYELTVQEGHPVHVITEFADRNQVDMLILGTHGNTGLTRYLIGSVAERVLRYAPCPVFIVKTKEVAQAIRAVADPQRKEVGDVLPEA